MMNDDSGLLFGPLCI